MVLGLGAALSVVGAALDIAAYARVQAVNEPFGDMGELFRWESTVYDMATAGDILLFGGAAIFIGGLIWALIERSRRNRRDANARSARDEILGPLSGENR